MAIAVGISDNFLSLGSEFSLNIRAESIFDKVTGQRPERPCSMLCRTWANAKI